MNQAPWSTGIGLVFVSNQTNKNLLLRSIGPSPLGGLSGLDLYKGKIDHIHGNFKRLDQNKKKKKKPAFGFFTARPTVWRRTSRLKLPSLSTDISNSTLHYPHLLSLCPRGPINRLHQKHPNLRNTPPLSHGQNGARL